MNLAAAVVVGVVAGSTPPEPVAPPPVPFHIVVERFSGIAVGRADCARQRIVLRVDFVQHASVPELVDVIAHEVAHLVTDCRAGHGPKWRREYERAAGRARP